MSLSKYFGFLFFSLFLGLLACMVPMGRYQWDGQSISVRVIDDYSGWGVCLVLLLSLFSIGWLFYKKKRPHPLFLGLLSGYMVGYALFRAFHNFTLFSNLSGSSLAHRLQAGSTPGEGIFILFTAGLVMLVLTIKRIKNNFQP